MTLTGFIILLIIAAICGSLGQALSGYSHGGCLVSIVLGFIGAYLGMLLAQQFGLPEWLAVNIGGQPFPILWSIIGAALVSAFFGFLNHSRIRA